MAVISTVSFRASVIVAQKVRIGDFEGDIMYDKDAHLVMLVDRASRLILMGKVKDKTADSVSKSNTLISMLKRAGTVHTITLDNSGEFALHSGVSQATKAVVYFAHPYASYQRRTNENTNGLICRV